MVAQHDRPLWLLLEYPAIHLAFRLFEILFVTRLKIRPVLLLKIMIMHPHLCLWLFLFVWRLRIQLFLVIKQLMRSLQRRRIVIAQRIMMPTQVLQFFSIEFRMLRIAPVLHQLLVRSLKGPFCISLLQTCPSERVLHCLATPYCLLTHIVLIVNWRVCHIAAPQCEMTRSLVHPRFTYKIYLLKQKLYFLYLLLLLTNIHFDSKLLIHFSRSQLFLVLAWSSVCPPAPLESISHSVEHPFIFFIALFVLLVVSCVKHTAHWVLYAAESAFYLLFHWTEVWFDNILKQFWNVLDHFW